MSLKTTLIILAALSCAACAGSQPTRPAATQEPGLAPQPVVAAPERVPVDEYLEFLDSLAVSISQGEPRPFTRTEINLYRRIDSQLRDQLEGYDNIEQLSTHSKLQVFNLHEELQAVVIGDPANQVICRREHRVGTNFRTTRCVNIDDFRDQQRAGQEFLRYKFGAPPMPVLDTP